MNPELDGNMIDIRLVVLGLYVLGILIGFVVSGATKRFGCGNWEPDENPLPEIAVFVWPVGATIGLFWLLYQLGRKMWKHD